MRFSSGIVRDLDICSSRTALKEKSGGGDQDRNHFESRKGGGCSRGVKREESCGEAKAARGISYEVTFRGVCMEKKGGLKRVSGGSLRKEERV